VMNVSAEGKPERVADVLISRKNHWLFRSSSGHYWSSPGAERNVMVETDRGDFPISFLDLGYHRPHVVARDLGAPATTIKELEALWEGRLERHGLKADLVPDPIQIGTVEPIEQVPLVAPGRELQIRFRLDSLSLENSRLQLLVNEVPVHDRDGIDVSGEIVETSVLLSRGLNEIEAFVVEESGMESIHWRGRTWLSATVASWIKPAIHVFAVGVSDYKNDDFDLRFAAKDALDLSSRFATLGKENGFREAFVHLVLDQQGTREEIIRTARKLQEAEVDDTVVVFFAGHGVVTSSGEYYFGTTDMNFEQPQESGISYQDIQSLFDGVAARRRFVFLDTCHAGELEASEVAAIRNDRNLESRGVTVRALAHNPTSNPNRSGRLIRSLFSDIRLDTGAHVLCAAQGAEFALEADSTQNGLFTHYLLKEIESKTADFNGDGNILAPELVNAVATKVSELTGGEQNPVMRESNSSLPFPLWPKEARDIDPEEVLRSYIELSEAAVDGSKRKLAVSYFSPRVSYFGKDWTPDEIEKDMKEYCEQYDSIQYQVKDVKMESQSLEEVVYRYLLHFHVQSELKQDPRTFRSYREVDRKGSVPSRIVFERDGVGWKIRELATVR
ncbi:MAG: caspase family protein, partial [Verrucomicrobiota bacterium]